MVFYWLFGKRYCKICGTVMTKSEGGWICLNPGHAERVRRSQAAKGKAGRKPTRKPVPVKYCLLCGVRMNRFKSVGGYRWKCPSPWHAERVRAKKRRVARGNRRGPRKKK